MTMLRGAEPDQPDPNPNVLLPKVVTTRYMAVTDAPSHVHDTPRRQPAMKPISYHTHRIRMSGIFMAVLGLQ